MPAFFNTLFESFYLLLLSSFLMYMVGHLLIALIRDELKGQAKSFFIKLSIGLIAIITLYAVFRTHFITMYSGVLFTLLIYLIINRNKLTINLSKGLKKFEFKIIGYYIVGLFIISFSATYLFYFDNRLLVHQDVAFYGRLGSALFENGVEVVNTEPFIYGTMNPSIYHFFNEWLISLFLNFSTFTSLTIFILLVLPLLTAVSFSGAMAVCDKYLKEESLMIKVLLSFLFLLIPGIISFLIHFLTNFNFSTPYSLLHGGIVTLKVKIVTILFLLYFVDENKKFQDKNMLPLILIPLFWNTLIPVFLGAYVLYIIYSYYVKKPLPLYLFFYWLVPLLYLPLHLKFASIFNSEILQHEIANQYGLTSYLIESYSSWSKFVLITIIIVAVAMILFLIVVLFYIKLESFLLNQLKFVQKPSQEETIFFVALFVAAIVSFGIMHDLFNARQILMNLLYPLINILLFVFVLFLINKGFKFKTSFLLILFAFIIGHVLFYAPKNSYEREKLVSIFKKLNPNNRKTYLASDIYKGSDPFYDYNKPFADLLMFDEDYKPINLSIQLKDLSEYKTPKEKIEANVGLGQLFYMFVKRNKLEGDVENAKVKFLKEFNIDYLLVNKNVVDNEKAYFKKIKIDTIVPFSAEVYLVKFKK